MGGLKADLVNPSYGAMLKSTIAVITGAGASVPLGMPAMRGFFDRLDAKSKGEVARFVGWSPELKDDLEFLLTRLDLWRQIFDERKRDPLFAAVLKDQEFRQTVSSAESLRETVFRAIIDTYGELSEEVQRKAVSLYVGLFSKLREKALEVSSRGRGPVSGAPVLPIFTTNYDLTFEAISQADGSFNMCNGMKRRGDSSMWDPDVYKAANYKFGVFRLHGCSHWVRRKRDGKILFQPIPDRENLSQREPCILYPEPGKDSRIHEEPYGLAYDHLRRCLAAAKVVIIVGYSGRDDAIQDALREALFADAQKKFVLVSKGKADTKPLRSAIPSDKILGHFDEGIEDASPKLIDAVDKYVSGG